MSERVTLSDLLAAIGTLRDEMIVLRSNVAVLRGDIVEGGA